MGTVLRIKFRTVFITVFCLSVIVLILFNSAASSNGITSGLEYSARLLIPSLFPFMVISSFIIRSGVSDIAGSIFSPVTRFLFRLPKAASSAVFLSFIGGFPVGAKCVRLLYDEDKITEAQAEQMMLFCVCSGPAFLITGVGVLMLGNIQAGIILYLSQVSSGIILGIISGLIYSENEIVNEKKNRHNRKKSIINEFILSCSDGAGAIIQLTAMVVFFSMFISVMEQTEFPVLFCRFLMAFGFEYPEADCVFNIILEVTVACKKICSGGCPLWLLAFASGFGGLCVHFQIFSVLGDIKISRVKFIAFRFVNACLSSAFVYILCRFYNPVSETFSLIGGGEAELTSTTFAGAVGLVIMCMIFVLSLKKSELSRTLFRRQHRI